LPPKQSLIYTAQPLLRQFPVFVGGVPIGFPKRYDVNFAIIADPSNSILESNELNNGVGLRVEKTNEPKLTVIEPGRCT
jgi:hypothetical protein